MCHAPWPMEQHLPPFPCVIVQGQQRRTPENRVKNSEQEPLYHGKAYSVFFWSPHPTTTISEGNHRAHILTEKTYGHWTKRNY
jgi:hypothetical protein